MSARVTLAGRDLTIGYSDRVVGRSLDVALEQGVSAGAARAQRRRQDHATQDIARDTRAPRGEVSIGSRSLSAISVRERARLIAYVPQVHNPTFAFTVEAWC
jgi:iron complex transport system ATP-binding protein